MHAVPNVHRAFPDPAANGRRRPLPIRFEKPSSCRTGGTAPDVPDARDGPHAAIHPAPWATTFPTADGTTPAHATNLPPRETCCRCGDPSAPRDPIAAPTTPGH